MDIRNCALAPLMALWASFAAFGGTSAGYRCVAPELIQSAPEEYNRLVCEGIRKLQVGKFVDAVSDFEKATSIPLFEQPNFELYPRLALASARAGDARLAQEYLVKAELSLKVFTGMLSCREGEDGWHLIARELKPISEKYADAIAMRMCGAAYDYIYVRDNLERVLVEAEMVRNYLDIRKQVLD